MRLKDSTVARSDRALVQAASDLGADAPRPLLSEALAGDPAWRQAARAAQSRCAKLCAEEQGRKAMRKNGISEAVIDATTPEELRRKGTAKARNAAFDAGVREGLVTKDMTRGQGETAKARNTAFDAGVREGLVTKDMTRGQGETAKASNAARSANLQAAARQGLIKEGMTRGQGATALARNRAFDAGAREGLIEEGMTRGQGEMARANQGALKKATERGIIVGKVSGAEAARALARASNTAKGSKTARQALESCVDLFTDPSRATRLADLLRQQLGKIIDDPSDRVTWAALLRAAAESPGTQGKRHPAYLGIFQREIPKKAPTRAELQEMTDKHAWAWMRPTFRCALPSGPGNMLDAVQFRQECHCAQCNGHLV